jgi:hypothetical protein
MIEQVYSRVAVEEPPISWRNNKRENKRQS